MLNFFDSILDFILAIFNGIEMFFNSIISIFSLIIKGLAYVTVCVSLMPPILQAFLLAFIGISVIYLVVGR